MAQEQILKTCIEDIRRLKPELVLADQEMCAVQNTYFCQKLTEENSGLIFILPAVSFLQLESVRESGSSDIKGRFYPGEADGSFKDLSPEAKQGREGGKALSGFACSGNIGGGYGSIRL